jgi:catechol 2,3-dioxygenase-like lactoylglutathione lyase family enzyme
MTTTTIGLTTISFVCLPTPEQDEAVAFYESLGFEKRTDQSFGGRYRWIEVHPPEGTTGIALAHRRRRADRCSRPSPVSR